MKDDGTFLNKIIFSYKLLLFPIKTCFYFLILNHVNKIDNNQHEGIIARAIRMLKNHVNKIDNNQHEGIIARAIRMLKKHVNKIVNNQQHNIFHVKKRFFASPQSVIGYSTLMLFDIITPYTIALIIGKFCPLISLFVQPSTYYSISIGVVAFIVTIMLALNMSVREIKTGEDFLNNLFEHCYALSLYLQQQKNKDRDTSCAADSNPTNTNKINILNIITPNINLGAGTNKTKELIKIIESNPDIIFRFICKSIDRNKIEKYINDSKKTTSNKHIFFEKAKQDTMLEFLYDRYNLKKERESVLDNIIQDIYDIMSKNNVIICCKRNSKWRHNNMVGYLSQIECVLGMYYNVEAEKGKVVIKAEMVKMIEFITHVEKLVFNMCKCDQKCMRNCAIS